MTWPLSPMVPSPVTMAMVRESRLASIGLSSRSCVGAPTIMSTRWPWARSSSARKYSGAAPLYFLAEELRAQGHRVDMIVGAPTQDLELKPIEAKRLSRTIAMVTGDGTIGDKGHVMDVLPHVVARSRSQVIYAAGPRPMLKQVAEYCRANRIPAQVAVEERMACG